MYDVTRMQSTLDEAFFRAESEIRKEFARALKCIYGDSKVPNKTTFGRVTISKHKLRNHDDLNSIIDTAGFYIILTDYALDNNNCRLVANGNLRAIYRGECHKIRKRIQSHLFNTKYKKDYEDRKRKYQSKYKGKEFHEQFWPACLKLKPGVNGINIDQPQFKNSNWLVIVHCMNGCKQGVRKQAELAFDELFGKPVACKERRIEGSEGSRLHS